jgi:hypothetical protein
MSARFYDGCHRHMRWAREETWTRLPGSPEWVSVPIQWGAMDLHTSAALLRPRSAYGGWRRGVLGQDARSVAGSADVLAFPELTEFLLNAALDRELDRAKADYQDLRSFCIDLFTPPDPRRYVGAKVEKLLLRASPREVLLRLSVRCAWEEPNDALTEDDFSYEGIHAVPFRLRGATVTLDGSHIAHVQSFALDVDNSLNAGPNVSGRPAYLIAGSRTARLELAKLHDSGVFNDALRTGGPLSFRATLAHPLGHELTLTLPHLYAEDNREDAPPSGVALSRTVLEAAAEGGARDLAYNVTLV